MIKEIEKLINSDISAYQLEKETGVPASTIQNVRLGKRHSGRF